MDNKRLCFLKRKAARIAYVVRKLVKEITVARNVK